MRNEIRSNFEQNEMEIQPQNVCDAANAVPMGRCIAPNGYTRRRKAQLNDLSFLCKEGGEKGERKQNPNKLKK